jgi:hypothetical protein
VQGGEVAGDIEQVEIVAVALGEAAHPHSQGTLVLGGEVGRALLKEFSCPRVHPDAGVAGQQR